MSTLYSEYRSLRKLELAMKLITAILGFLLALWFFSDADAVDNSYFRLGVLFAVNLTALTWAAQRFADSKMTTHSRSQRWHNQEFRKGFLEPLVLMFELLDEDPPGYNWGGAMESHAGTIWSYSEAFMSGSTSSEISGLVTGIRVLVRGNSVITNEVKAKVRDKVLVLATLALVHGSKIAETL